MRKKFRTGLIVAVIACLIVTAAGFAAARRWGLFDFFARYADVTVLPEAAGIVETNPPQQGGETELARFIVREAVYDGERVYLIVDVEPREGILLLGADALPEESIGEIAGQAAKMTFEEYALENRLQMVRASVGGDLIDMLDYRLEADGTLVYSLSGPAPEGGEATLEGALTGVVYPLIAVSSSREAGLQEVESDGQMYYASAYAADWDNRQTTQVHFTLEASGHRGAAQSAQSAQYASCGALVESVTLNASPLAVYYEIRFRVIDEAAYAATDGGLWFEFIDEDGNPLPDGAAAGGEVRPLEDGGYVQTGSLSAIENLPDSITLRGYNCWTKERYETQTIALNDL